MINKLHRLGYTESYSETQNYKYWFDRKGDYIQDISGNVDTILEESYEQINDEVAVDAALEDLSIPTDSESDDQVISIEVGEASHAIT